MSRPLRPSEAKALLAEAGYLGRDLGHALRGPSPVTEEEAAKHYSHLFSKVRDMVLRHHPDFLDRFEALEDMLAFCEVARLHFKWRMTDTHPEEDV